MKKLRVAVFSDVFLEASGGIVTSIRAQKQALEKAGHEVTIFCPGSKNVKPEPGVMVVPTCRHLKPGDAPLARRPKVVEKWILKEMPDFGERFDVVHVHYEAGCSIAGVRLAKKYHLRLLQTMHGREDSGVEANIPHPFKTIVACLLNFFHGLYLPHKKTIKRDNYLATTVARAKMWTLMVNHASQADQVLSPSRHFAQKLQHYGVKKPISVVSNGVADNLMTKKLKTRVFAGGELKVIWNSRVSYEKRIMEFLEALKIVGLGVSLDVYGDGNALKKAQKYVKKHRLKVRFFGATKYQTILQKMTDYHLGVTVSYNFDTQGMTILEAQAMGLPVLIADPDLSEVAARGGFILAKDPSPQVMAEALKKILAQPELIEKMSKVMCKKRMDVAQSGQLKKLLVVYTKN